MRQLTREETEVLFAKLAKYIGRNISRLVDVSDNPHGFRMNKNRVYYGREELFRKAENVPRDNILSIGTCFGKFTKTGKFRLHVTALDYLAPYAKYKVWLKSTGEMTYLYGGHVLKAHLSKMTEDTPEHQGVLVYSSADIAVGFAVSAKSSLDCQRLDPTGICCFHQTDVGEYLRDEETLI